MAGPEPTTGPLTPEELQLATRNRGTPLEGLRYDTTPTGLHYLGVHYDIAALDASSWRLRVGGNVERALNLSLDEMRARPRRTLPATIECAGNGRAHVLSCRAPDAAGNLQPTEPLWNYQGMGKNLAQTVRVMVR
jgi:DMSO/TMAO reductase YedYZ molybdopterin-dependent catalytic subunit